MKKFLLLVCVTALSSVGFSQKMMKNLEENVKLTEIKSHLYFLASDEMRGRNVGTVENEIAARYIAERFRSYGVKMGPGMESYFQDVNLIKAVTPQTATLEVVDRTFNLGEDMVFYTANNGEISGELIYAGYGLEDDLNGLDIKGKIVVAKTGRGVKGERITSHTIKKQELIENGGGIGLLEIYNPGIDRYPWRLMKYYFSGEKFKLGSDDQTKKTTVPAAWVHDTGGVLSFFQENNGSKATMKIGGQSNQLVKVPNVVGYIEGTDPKLKEEFIMISAHFDHVGVRGTEGDSIYNGARDNGIGIANMLTAAEFLAKNPPKRSVAFLACNAEEVGLFGSEWYADHPVIPLEKTVFDLNTDTGGYNDVTKVTVVGFNRTSVTDLFVKASDAFGLTAIDDPLPEENYYDRSDNVSFAAKGVPSVSFDPGYTEMNEEITKYYHQPTDEPNTLDYAYLTTYSKAFIYAVSLIGNTTEPIVWTKGDKYEEAGNKLYGLK